MSGPINRYPEGLLSLFQIKSLGETPSKFEDTVRPTIDLTNNYLTNVGLSVAATVELGVDFSDLNNRIALVEVPQDELWFVRGVTSMMETTTYAASEYINTYPTLVDAGGGSGWNFPFTNGMIQNTFVPGGGQGKFATATFDNPLVVPGGASFYSAMWRGAGTTHKSSVWTRVLHYAVKK